VRDSSRHHHNPEVLLRQFAEPMFSDSIRVFEKKTGRWDPNRRTPNGVGWERHLYTGWDDEGNRHDKFERFLGKHVDDRSSNALKKAAVDPENLTGNDYAHLAHFIAFAAGRSRGIMEHVERDHNARQKRDDPLVKAWCELVGIPFNDDSESKMVRESLFRAIDINAHKWRNKLLSGKWSVLKVPRETPFITSDWPALASTEGELWVLTFAVSSEVAFLISNHPDSGFPNPGPEDVKAVNLRTMARATRFIVSHKDSFPGDEALTEWSKRKADSEALSTQRSLRNRMTP
jgi:hypothetical protein